MLVIGVGGYFYVVVFNTIFSNSEPICHFLAKQTEFRRIFLSTTFLTRIFSYSILKGNLCTSRRTQLQQKIEMSVSYYFELYAANIFAAMTRRFLSTYVEPVPSRE